MADPNHVHGWDPDDITHPETVLASYELAASEDEPDKRDRALFHAANTLGALMLDPAVDSGLQQRWQEVHDRMQEHQDLEASEMEQQFEEEQKAALADYLKMKAALYNRGDEGAENARAYLHDSPDEA